MAESLGWVVVAARLLNHRGMGARGEWRVFGAHALMTVLRGRGEYLDREGARRVLEPGDVVWVAPWSSHWYGPAGGTTWDEQFVVFDGPVFDAWARSKYRPIPPIFKTRDPDTWGSRLDAIARIKGEVPQALAVQAAIAELVDLFEPEESEGPAWLSTAKRLLGDFDSGSPELGEVARAVGMPYETFRKRFQAEAGVGPGSYREQRRTEAAANLLRYTNFVHSEIAARLGYGNEYYFSRRFKAVTGASPSAYRRRERSGW